MRSALSLSALLFFACSDPGGGGSSGAVAGTLGGACYPNQTCNGGLECFRGLCVSASDTPDAQDTSASDTTPPEDTFVPADTTPADTTPEDTFVPADTTPEDTFVPADTTPADTTPPDDCGDFVCDLGEEETCPSDCERDDRYYAVLVTDAAIFPFHRPDGSDPCATASSPYNMHGADIDAVGLFDDGDLLSYFDTVDYRDGGLCPNKPTMLNDPDDARGAPDGELAANAVSLGGGFVIGEFEFGLEILSGYDIVVYEIGTRCGDDLACGGIDEGYDVFLARDLDCVNEADYPYAPCAVKIADDAEGEATIPVTGF